MKDHEYIASVVAILSSFFPFPCEVAGRCLVLVFAATPSEMALWSVLFNE